MTSDIELAAQRIRQLVDLTKALTARLAEETRAFEAQRLATKPWLAHSMVS